MNGKTIAILAAGGVEQGQYARPKQAVEEAGAGTELLSLEAGETQVVAASGTTAG